MIYTQNRKKKKTGKVFIFGIIILFFLFTLFGDFVIRNTTNNVLGKVFHFKNVIFSPLKTMGTAISDKNKLKEEISELNELNKKLEIENLTVQVLRNENEGLKRIISDLDENNQNVIIEKVLQTPPFSPYDNLIITARNQSFNVGDNVYFGKLILGKVKEKYNDTALVELLSSPNQTIQARINDQYDIEAKGLGNLSFITLLPKDLNIKKGDIVSFKDIDQAILGIVQDVKVTETSTFQEIYFNFPISFSEIRFVEIK